VDEGVADLEGIEGDLANPELWSRDGDNLITDAIGDMQGWACFHPDESGPPEPPEVEVPVPLPQPPEPIECVPPKPFIRGPKIGRNEPCPCGSGKKYKKCCGKL
jgi:uncharacterized protein YecA (UPF0149 family)